MEIVYMLECPLYKPIRDKLSSPFRNTILGNLKSFFQLDHQVHINLDLNLTETSELGHSTELNLV